MARAAARTALAALAAVALASAACTSSQPPTPRPRAAVARTVKPPEPVFPHAPDGPRPEALATAARAWRCARSQSITRSRYVTLIDYSLPSTEPRLWVLDFVAGRVLFRERVTHGRGSGDDYAVAFSNVEGSHQTSLGVFRTAETYVGGHGYSLVLDGLEPGFNDQARKRKIVMHGAPYATADFVAEKGRLGLSLGCPAVDPAVAPRLIDRIREGSLVVAWYPDADWLTRSTFLACPEPEPPTLETAGGVVLPLPANALSRAAVAQRVR